MDFSYGRTFVKFESDDAFAATFGAGSLYRARLARPSYRQWDLVTACFGILSDARFRLRQARVLRSKHIKTPFESAWRALLSRDIFRLCRFSKTFASLRYFAEFHETYTTKTALEKYVAYGRMYFKGFRPNFEEIYFRFLQHTR